MRKWNSLFCIVALLCSLLLQGCVSEAHAVVNLTPILENTPSSFLCIKDHSLGIFSTEAKEFISLKTYPSAKSISFKGFVSSEDKPIFCLEIHDQSFFSTKVYTEVWCYNVSLKTLEKVVTLPRKDLQLVNSTDGGYHLAFITPDTTNYCWYSGCDQKLHYPTEFQCSNIEASYFTSLPNILIVSESVLKTQDIDFLIDRNVYAYYRIDLSFQEKPTLIGYGYRDAMKQFGSVFFFEKKYKLSSYDIVKKECREYPFPTYDYEWGILDTESIYVTILNDVEDIKKIYQVHPQYGLRNIPIDSDERILVVESFQNNLFVKSQDSEMTRLLQISLPPISMSKQDESSIEKEVLYEVPTDSVYRSTFLMPSYEITLRHSELLKSGIYRFIAITKNFKPMIHDFDGIFDPETYHPEMAMEYDLPDKGTTIRFSNAVIDKELVFPDMDKNTILYLYNDVSGCFNRLYPPGSINGDYIIPITPRTISNSGKYAIVATGGFFAEPYSSYTLEDVKESSLYLYDLESEEPPYYLGVGTDLSNIIEIEDYLQYTNENSPYTLLFWLD
ncbi:MAG TPA: hypothetical protein PLE09_05910 [Caldisericia bacterium]|nr:hypothetical protein [Caldisericia bacterium]HXK52049.1 hypothetical protein [Caldisericia bacterium]